MKQYELSILNNNNKRIKERSERTERGSVEREALRGFSFFYFFLCFFLKSMKIGL